MDQVGLIPVLVSLHSGQGQWKIWRKLQAIQVGKTWLLVGPILIHPSNGRLGPRAGR